MKILFFILLLEIGSIADHPKLHSINSHNQQINWKLMSDWKLYYTYDDNAADIEFDSLNSLPSVSLNSDTMANFMTNVKSRPTDDPPVWMGYYLVSCKSPEGNKLKVIISHYGHFFYDVKGRVYYTLEGGKAKPWRDYFHDKWDKLQNSHKE